MNYINSVVVASSEVLSSDIGGESVILNLNSGIYYSLTQVGATVWNFIQTPKTVEEILDLILQEYEVDSAQCEQDLLVLLEELLASDLIEVKEVAVKDEAIA
jgi:hypothetical protein